jgi:hypothetical protein
MQSCELSTLDRLAPREMCLNHDAENNGFTEPRFLAMLVLQCSMICGCRILDRRSGRVEWGGSVVCRGLATRQVETDLYERRIR